MSSFGRVVTLFGLCLGLVLVGLTSPGVASGQLPLPSCTSAGCNTRIPPGCTPIIFSVCNSNNPNANCECQVSRVIGVPATCTCYLMP